MTCSLVILGVVYEPLSQCKQCANLKSDVRFAKNGGAVLKAVDRWTSLRRNAKAKIASPL